MASVPARRTQAERRESTRAALLEATIACVVEDGYAQTTMRRVADRAGVSLGALQHHFASKGELVAEALGSTAEQLAEQILDATLATADSAEGRAAILIDALWETYSGPLFTAGLELLVAARTDAELRRQVDQLTERIVWRVVSSAGRAFPELISRPGSAEALVTGLSTIGGLALQRLTPGFDADAFWPATRAHLLSLLDEEEEVGPG